MIFRNWCIVSNFRDVREFTNSHAFVEEIEQPFGHNATDCFQEFGWNVIGTTIRFQFEVFNEKLDFICISRS